MASWNSKHDFGTHSHQTNTTVGPGQPYHSELKPITEALEKELRRAREANNCLPSCSITSSAESPPKSLIDTLASCLSQSKHSNQMPCSSNKWGDRSNAVGRGNQVSLTYSQLQATEKPSSALAKELTTKPGSIFSKMASPAVAPSIDSATSCPLPSAMDSSLSGQGSKLVSSAEAIGDAGQCATSTAMSTVAGKKGALNAPAAIGATATKVVKRRKRLSRRVQTKIIEADSANFRATVQQLTGFPTGNAASVGATPTGGITQSQTAGPVVRPQPKRPAMNKVNVNQSMDIPATNSMSSPGLTPFSQSPPQMHPQSDTSGSDPEANFFFNWRHVNSQPATQRMIIPSPVTEPFQSLYQQAEWMAFFASHQSNEYSASQISAAASMVLPYLTEAQRGSDRSRESSISEESWNSVTDNISRSSVVGTPVSVSGGILSGEDLLDLDDFDELSTTTTHDHTIVDSWLSPPEFVHGLR